MGEPRTRGSGRRQACARGTSGRSERRICHPSFTRALFCFLSSHDDALAYRNDPEFARYLSHIPQPFERHHAEAFVATNMSESWDTSPAFGVGGVGLDSLFTPPHLVEIAAAAIMVSGPLRAAARRGEAVASPVTPPPPPPQAGPPPQPPVQ